MMVTATPANSAASGIKDESLSKANNPVSNNKNTTSSESPDTNGISVVSDDAVEVNSSTHSDVVPEERLVFSGTDPDTVEMAKSFWKSVTLQPPLESSLIAHNIQQRLPKARSIKSVAIKPNLAHKKPSEDVALKKFFARANHKLIADRTDHVKRLAYHRMQMLLLLEKRKKERQKKELVSEDFKPPVNTLNEMDNFSSFTAEEDFILYTEEELERELEMLKTFEETVLREIQTPSSVDEQTNIDQNQL